MGGTLLAIETSQSWERPGEHGEDEEVVWSSSPSGPLEPCFMIFLYLERLFWNHIFTFSKQKRKKEHYNTCNKNTGHSFYNLSNSFQDIWGLFFWHPFCMMILALRICQTAWTVFVEMDSVTSLRFITHVLSNCSALPFLWRQWSMSLTTTITA